MVVETRKADGSYYTPTSINALLAGIQWQLWENLGGAAPNIIDRKNDLLPKKKNALDQQLQLLRSKGIGVMKKQASSDYS